MSAVPSVGRREAGPVIAAAIAETDRATVRGYASVFGAIDLSGDRIEPGAFAASLRRRGPGEIRMLWQHDTREPIGCWMRVVEDARGLFVEGEITRGSARGRDAFELIRAGAIDGLSIGFKATRSRREAGGVRRLLEIDLWEISIVTFPMQRLARIARNRGRAIASGLAERIAAGALSIANPAASPAR